MNQDRPAYRGRFAPSPSGPLHLGSLLTAAASYLDSRANEGQWLVRMEDIDHARCKPAWAADILRTLEAFGFEWDGEVVYQTSATRQQLYRQALKTLQASGQIFGCSCSRHDVRFLDGIGEPRYPGTCRYAANPEHKFRTWRVKVDDTQICFDDRRLGKICSRLDETTGDFVVARLDGSFTYHLAVVVDDSEQQITDVVRGADLLDSTPRQIFLQTLLHFPQPRYLHLPLVLNQAGQKLSKQNGATAIDPTCAAASLIDVFSKLHLLTSSETEALFDLSIDQLWRWAAIRWAGSYPSSRTDFTDGA